ncbi:MAG TPA: metallophosphoesterase [Verrucomicrobiae bacterium]
MSKPLQFLICSDIHYASKAEKARVGYEAAAVDHPLPRTFLKLYRRHYWLRDPFAHNHLLDQVLHPPFEPDWVIANGDYSCDSEFIGMSDPPSLQSARESLGKLRKRFGEKLLTIIGDHELGKTSLFSHKGGLRLKSLELAQTELRLRPLWTKRFGNYVLIGITSTLAAMEIYARETLSSERPQWEELARQHLCGIDAIFNALASSDRVLLFCHDPTALPFLWQLESIRTRANQIERTIIGHLHSPIVLAQSRILSGLPKISFLGHAVQRMSTALSQAKDWKPFKVLLCPSLTGLQITKHGGYYQLQLDPTATASLTLQFYRIHW